MGMMTRCKACDSFYAGAQCPCQLGYRRALRDVLKDVEVVKFDDPSWHGDGSCEQLLYVNKLTAKIKARLEKN